MNQLLEVLGELLRYPDDQFERWLDEAVALSEGDHRSSLERFRMEMSGVSLAEAQEIYTRTFDLSPMCSLEVGWQLYGEDYARGSFLVYARTQLIEHGLPERGELPDHLAHLLPLMPRMAAAKADELREAAALPAIRKMLRAFDGSPNPYGGLLNAIAGLLQVPFEQPAEEPSHV